LSYENAEGDKKVIPFFQNSGFNPGYDKEKKTRPLYNAECIDNFETVFIVEGEKCVEACKAIGIENCITWPGGSSGVKSADWSKIQNKKIIIWPDNDQPGEKAALELKEIFQGQNCGVQIIAIPAGLERGGDVADLIEAGKSQQEILNIFQSSEKPLIALAVSEFMASEVAERESLCGFVFENSISMIYAWRGIGKTMFGLSLGYALATGRDFLKWETAGKSRVLYLDGEMPESTMHSRLNSICEMNDGETPAAKNFLLCGHYTNLEYGEEK